MRAQEHLRLCMVFGDLKRGFYFFCLCLHSNFALCLPFSIFTFPLSPSLPSSPPTHLASFSPFSFLLPPPWCPQTTPPPSPSLLLTHTMAPTNHLPSSPLPPPSGTPRPPQKMITTGSRRIVLATALALSLTCCSITPTTVNIAMAQVTPSAVQDMAFARSGSDLFIQGGYVAINSVSQSVSSQLVALDLSSPWGVASPVWRALANGTASRSFNGVSLPTNKTFLSFKYLDPNQYTITAYDVTTNTWSLPTPVTTVTDILSYGLRPVVDPTSGLVYIAGRAGMNVYNPATQLWTAPTPISGLTARYFGSGLYNTARKTIMYVGGYNYGVAPTHFDPVVVVTEFSPSASTWTVLVWEYMALFFLRCLAGRDEEPCPWYCVVRLENISRSVNWFAAPGESTLVFSSFIKNGRPHLGRLPVQGQTIAPPLVSACLCDTIPYHPPFFP